MADQQPPQKKKKLLNAQHEARVDMINGNFPLPEATVLMMRSVRSAIANCAHLIEEVQKFPEFLYSLFFLKKQEMNRHGAEHDLKVDGGRVTAGFDLLQQAKNVFCDAVILPHATPRKDE